MDNTNHAVMKIIICYETYGSTLESDCARVKELTVLIMWTDMSGGVVDEPVFDSGSNGFCWHVCRCMYTIISCNFRIMIAEQEVIQSWSVR